MDGRNQLDVALPSLYSQQKMDSKHARFTLLRWAVNEDDDDWLAREEQAEANAVSTVPTLVEHIHLVVVKWQFVRTVFP